MIPALPDELATRLAGLGCSLTYDPQVGRWGYRTEWRMDGWPGGPALFTDLASVELCLSRLKPDKTEEVNEQEFEYQQLLMEV